MVEQVRTGTGEVTKWQCVSDCVWGLADKFDSFCELAEPLLKAQHPDMSKLELYRQLLHVYDKCSNVSGGEVFFCAPFLLTRALPGGHHGRL